MYFQYGKTQGLFWISKSSIEFYDIKFLAASEN